MTLAALSLVACSTSESTYLLGNPRLLVIGLGGGALPAFIGRHWPHFQVDAVEIDSRVIEAAIRWFGLQVETTTSPLQATDCGFSEDAEGRPCRVHCADAAEFVSAAAPQSFDCVLLDVYTNACFPPSLLSTSFFQHLRRVLTPCGSLVVNAGIGSDCRSVLALARDAFGAGDATLVLDSARAEFCLGSSGALGDAQENGVVACGALSARLRSLGSQDSMPSTAADLEAATVDLAQTVNRSNPLAIAEWRRIVQALPAELEPCPFELRAAARVPSADAAIDSVFIGWRGVDVNAAFQASQRRAQRALAASRVEAPRVAAADDALWAVFD